MEIIKTKAKTVVITMMAIYIPMWFFFILNNVIFSFSPLNHLFGILPRDFSFTSLIGIMTFWLSHTNFQHIMNNSVSMAGLLFFIALFEKKVYKIIPLLILTSGFSVWLLGAPNSFHVGASGLVFACLGYILSSLFLSKRIIYIIPVILSLMYYGAAYFFNFLNGFVPQAGISFAGHFGGFLSGILVSFIINRKVLKNKSEPLIK